MSDIVVTTEVGSYKYTITGGIKIMTTLKATTKVYYQIMLSSRKHRYKKRVERAKLRGEKIPEDVDLTPTEEVLIDFLEKINSVLESKAKP